MQAWLGQIIWEQEKIGLVMAMALIEEVEVEVGLIVHARAVPVHLTNLQTGQAKTKKAKTLEPFVKVKARTQMGEAITKNAEATLEAEEVMLEAEKVMLEAEEARTVVEEEKHLYGHHQLQQNQSVIHRHHWVRYRHSNSKPVMNLKHCN